jgi:hypothetical protein
MDKNDLETEDGKAQLTLCPKCYGIIDLNETESISDDVIVGCGLEEDDFSPCVKCIGEDDPEECEYIRDTLGFTKTTFKELCDSEGYNK